MEPTTSGDVTTNSSSGKESSNFNELYLASTILVCLAVIGTAGNAIVIYVFNRKKDNAVSTFFILTLAVVDFVTCLFVIPFIIFMLNVGFEIRCNFFCKAGLFLDISSILFSAFVMVAIAIDRYLCICHPFKRIMTVPRAKLLVVCMAVIAGAIGVCMSLLYDVHAYAHGNHRYKDGETFVSTADRKESTPSIYQSEIDINFSGLEVIMKQSSAGVNLVSGPTETSRAEIPLDIIYTGHCVRNAVIFSMEFKTALLNFHRALFMFCFVAVLFLYILIYRSVLLQRKTRRRLQKKGHLSTTKNPASDDNVLESPSQMIRPRQTDELSAESAATRAANLKTAAMLFVVTIVFALSYLPTALIQYGLIPYNTTVFYMFFVNSAANPIIYSFMNRNFRKKVKMLISRR